MKMELHCEMLAAIQVLPGETAGEKYCNILKVVRQALTDGQKLEKAIDLQHLPKELLPFYEVESAKLTKKHDIIVEALKSEDILLLNRAFKTSSFFDGSDLVLTNPNYFSKNLLPFVSLNTRLRIVKYLSINLFKKGRTQIAEKFFDCLYEEYGLEQALPLITACSEDFVYKTIVEKKVVLPAKFVKILYRSKPNLVIKYLQLSCKNQDPNKRNIHAIELNHYEGILCKLVKEHIDSFVELLESNSSLKFKKLSKKVSRMFLKNGKQYFLNKPKFYLTVLPLELINVSTMNLIFFKLMKESHPSMVSFDTNQMLNYLKYYPENDKCELIVKTYEQCYSKSIFDSVDHVTADFMLILPPEKRIELARVKLSLENCRSSDEYQPKKAWRCYLPTNETFPEIKKEISLSPNVHERLRLITHLVYNCKVNQEKDCFLEMLKYFETRHTNEQSILLSGFMDSLINEFDLLKLSSQEWVVLDCIIQRSYVKDIKESFQLGQTVVKLLVKSLHYKLVHNLPIDQQILMFVETQVQMFKFRQWYRNVKEWNILTDHREYEKMCLKACIKEVIKIYDNSSNASTVWLESCYEVLDLLLLSLRKFHFRHLKNVDMFAFMCEMSYPALVDKILKSKNLSEDKENHKLNILKESLYKHAKSIYHNYWPDNSNNEAQEIADVSSGAALVLLRRNSKDVLKHWSGYLESCKKNFNQRNVVSFIRAVRWYNDIPMVWLKQCQKELSEEKNCEALKVLGALLERQSFSKLVCPFLPTKHCIEVENENAKLNYNLVASIPYAMKVVNPPPPLDIVSKLCQGNYLTSGLAALTNVSRRTSVTKVLPFAQSLACQRVSVGKHGFRILFMVGSLREILEFFSSQWETENHYSVRAVIVNKVKEMFVKNPSEVSWTLLKKCVSDLEAKDEECLKAFCKLCWVPNDFIYEHVSLMFNVIDKIEKSGLKEEKFVTHTCSLIKSIDVPASYLLPETFSMGLIQKYFFHPNQKISRVAQRFALNDYILLQDQKRMLRVALFTSFFVDVARKQWNEPHSKKSHFFPINFTVNNFIDSLVRSTPLNKIDLQLIEEMLKMFQTAVDPKMDAQSFLLLAYTREYLQSKSLTDFGSRIGQSIKRLVEIFSEFLIAFMAKVLNKFLDSNLINVKIKDEKALDVIEGLIEAKNTYSLLMAAELLEPIETKEYVSKYDKIVLILLNQSEPAIMSIVCSKINSVSYDTCIFETVSVDVP